MNRALIFLLAGLVLGGCAVQPGPHYVPFRAPPRVEHASLEAAGRAAWQAAARAERERGGRYTVNRVNALTGSMYPVYRGPFYAVLELTTDWRRAPGGLAIRRVAGTSGLVCHAVGPADGGGALTYGIANARHDYGRMTAENMVGIVVETHHGRAGR